MAPRLFVGGNGEPDMVDYPGPFVWYELMTTDMAAAKAFYGEVVGWGVQDASTPDLGYTLFTAGTAPVSGLMELPEEARNMGATPRWVGYVGVDDIDATADRIKRLGGAVYVPPTDTNIGRISIVADPQTATFALVEGLKPALRQTVGMDEPGHVGWHELLAADWETAFRVLWRAVRLAESGRRNRFGGHLSVVLRRRADRRRQCSPSVRCSRSRSGFITSMSTTSMRRRSA